MNEDTQSDHATHEVVECPNPKCRNGLVWFWNKFGWPDSYSCPECNGEGTIIQKIKKY